MEQAVTVTCYMKSCRRYIAHLLINKATNFIVPCCCVEKPLGIECSMKSDNGYS